MHHVRYGLLVDICIGQPCIMPVMLVGDGLMAGVTSGCRRQNLRSATAASGSALRQRQRGGRHHVRWRSGRSGKLEMATAASSTCNSRARSHAVHMLHRRKAALIREKTRNVHVEMILTSGFDDGEFGWAWDGRSTARLVDNCVHVDGELGWTRG